MSKNLYKGEVVLTVRYQDGAMADNLSEAEFMMQKAARSFVNELDGTIDYIRVDVKTGERVEDE